MDHRNTSRPTAFRRRRSRCLWSAAAALSVGATLFMAAPATAAPAPDAAAVQLVDTAQASAGPALTIEDSRSIVSVRATGDVRAIAESAGLSSSHSALQSTGRFVRAGQTVTVTVPADATGLEASIGLHGNYWGINECHDVGLETTTLQSGINTVVAPHDGLVYLQNTAGAEASTVTVEGGKPVPTFIAGETDRAAFDAQLDAWDAPLFTLVGERVFADFQRQGSFADSAFSNEHALASIDLDDRVAAWDAAVRMNDSYFGLSAAETAGRVHVVAPSHSGLGGHPAAKAWDGFIKSPSNKPDGMSPMLERYTNIAFFSALGSTYGSPLLDWSDGHSEYAKIVDSLADASSRETFAGFPASTHEKNATMLRTESFGQYTSYLDWTRGSAGKNTGGLVFQQLDWAFGAGFLTELIREHREAGSSTATKDDFALAASAKAGVDLSAHFAAWEIPLTATTKAELAKLPKVEGKIWAVYSAPAS